MCHTCVRAAHVHVCTCGEHVRVCGLRTIMLYSMCGDQQSKSVDLSKLPWHSWGGSMMLVL